MIKREHYLNKIRPFYDSDLIKIITGIRRCGKSVVLGQIKEEITLKSNNVIYLNFEDRATSNHIRTGDELIKYVLNNKKEGKCYVFLDELQYVSEWNIACRTLRLHDCSLFITGSNSKLLSGEFVKELSGRYVSFRIKPFVYKEILEYCKELNKETNIIDYLVYGGFPKIFEFDNKETIKTYLNDLDQTIVINDIVNRYHVRKEELFKRLVNYVLISNSRIFSSKSIKDYIKKEFLNCSINTISKYLSYLKEAYIINAIKPYSKRAKRELDYYEKIYNEDVCFNTIRCMDNKYDLTHNLENIIYNELVYRGYELNVYTDKDKEIDFIAKKGNFEYCIQVAYSIAEESTYRREFAPFDNLDNSRRKIIITNDEIDYSTSTVTHLKLKDFLMCVDLQTIIK